MGGDGRKRGERTRDREPGKGGQKRCVCVGGGGGQEVAREQNGSGGGGVWDCNVPLTAQGHLGDEGVGGGG